MAVLNCTYFGGEKPYLEVFDNGKKRTYYGVMAVANYRKILVAEIDQLEKQLTTLHLWYANPDNMDKPNWREIKSQHDALAIKIQAKKDYAINLMSRISLSANIDTDTFSADIFISETR